MVCVSMNFAKIRPMINAAIIGLGRWGRALVASVQGRSDAIRFVLAHPRTRGPAEDFCREYGLRPVESYQQILSDPAAETNITSL